MLQSHRQPALVVHPCGAKYDEVLHLSLILCRLTLDSCAHLSAPHFSSHGGRTHAAHSCCTTPPLRAPHTHCLTLTACHRILFMCARNIDSSRSCSTFPCVEYGACRINSPL